ncbi:MAG: 30S ribosomal protein S4 [Candidatus Bilamarchaeaceae archaeon]
MGDPRRLRNKFSKPKRLWDEDRIKRDTQLKKEYGLKNSSEIWKADEELRKYRREARRLLSLGEEERLADAKKILTKLSRLGIMKGGTIDDILSLSVRDILERRLQTIVYRKGLAKSPKQARQLITHGFISVNGRKVNVPSYLVLAKEEDTIKYTKPIDLSAGEFKEEKKAPSEGENKTE